MEERPYLAMFAAGVKAEYPSRFAGSCRLRRSSASRLNKNKGFPMSVAGSGGSAVSLKSIQARFASRWTLGFFCIFVGGAWLRLRGLTFQSYWDDELFSVAVSLPRHSLEQVVQLTFSDVHPPLFQLLLWVWFKVFGFSELSGRLLPALFGISALPVLYRLGCELRSRAVGFSMALLCAVNIFHLQYSQEVRSYSLLFLLGSLSLLYFMRLLDTPTRRSLVGWMLASTAMVYTHYFGALALAAEWTVLLFLLRQRARLRRPALVAAVGFGAAALPLVPQVIRSASLSNFWIVPPAPDFLVDYFLNYFGSPFIAVAVAVAMFHGVFRGATDARSTVMVRLLLSWLAAILLLPYIRSVLAIPLLTARNTIIALPAIFLLAALGIAAIRNAALRRLLVCGLFVFSTLHIFYDRPYHRTPAKPQIRQAAQALIAAHPQVDAVFAPAEVVDNFNVYFELYDAPFRVRPLEQLPALDGSVPLPPRFWLIDGRAARALNVPIMKDPRLRIVERRDFRNAAFAEMEPVH